MDACNMGNNDQVAQLEWWKWSQLLYASMIFRHYLCDKQEEFEEEKVSDKQESK